MARLHGFQKKKLLDTFIVSDLNYEWNSNAQIFKVDKIY